ncbi:phage major tail tube protein [Zooshikella ganghwensis]|uniref:Phage major tail tube protein n=1 Tax=Zooshikella ganghwensis TaxID=202772 RepID=A0A4P9VH18_9GAMM|nr:phage major tail tube protein [Zooshikella ganghwensis]RDH41644.1 phage major tail tube protein [Zooshikella ganghwensis]RDH41657.1 phage major tail tube protein [Zooshikella ganghwensis]RDH41679.1 phage major tail tube protein [Zooshikella ganghwensis]RDH41736.1 phage major tail tube protein [Zooshikella ganghwensis]
MIKGYRLLNCNLWLDGVNMQGVISEITPPKLTAKTEELYAGGMSAPINLLMGLEALELSFSLNDMNVTVLENFGLYQSNEGLQVKVTGGLQNGNNASDVKPLEINATGIVSEVDMGTLKPGEVGSMSVTMKLDYYKLTIDKKVLSEIDPINMIQVVNGQDQLKAMRNALGL